MTTVKVLLSCALVASAQAQGAPEQSMDRDVTLMAFRSAHWGAGVLPPTGTESPVLTLDYWLRALEERALLQIRYGVSARDGAAWQPVLQHQVRVPGRLPLSLLQDALSLGGRPLAGLHLDKRDVFFEGDQVSIRSFSDTQALARGIGLIETESETAILSLLGWRSRSEVAWQLGDPTREVQCRFSAVTDRRAAAQKGTVGFELLRRF